MTDVNIDKIEVDEITEEFSENFIQITESYGIELVGTQDQTDFYAIWTDDDGWLQKDFIEVSAGMEIAKVVEFAMNLPY